MEMFYSILTWDSITRPKAGDLVRMVKDWKLSNANSLTPSILPMVTWVFLEYIMHYTESHADVDSGNEFRRVELTECQYNISD